MTAWPGKVRLVGFQVTTDPSPVPVRLTVGFDAALVTTVTLPFLVPTEGGVKVTLTVQLAPAAKLLPQLLVWAKSPFAVMLVIVMESLPVLLKVTGWAGLVVLTA